MASNFDFLKKIDKELFEIIEEAQRLFRSEYFNQCTIQIRIYAEKMAKKIIGKTSATDTFDDILNTLKDKIQTEREKEFIEDLFFIKKQGNACAHGEQTSASSALETLKRAFEAGISYAYYKEKDENLDKLLFDEELLILEKKEKKEDTLIEKYLKRAMEGKKEAKLQENFEETKEQKRENLLNNKQGEFLSQTTKMNQDEELGSFEGLKDRFNIENPAQYNSKNEKKEKRGRKKKEFDPKKEEIKEKIKQAKKNLKENINKEYKKAPQKKTPNKNSKAKAKAKAKPKQKAKPKFKKNNNETKGQMKAALFLAFLLISLYFLFKLIF